MISNKAVRGIIFIALCLATIRKISTLSCIASSSGQWRLCSPKEVDNNRICKCDSIVLDYKGDSDCASRHANTPFCYVFGDHSNCEDAVISSTKEVIHEKYWNMTVAISFEACKTEVQSPTEIGNEEILRGIEIKHRPQNFFMRFLTNSAKSCKLECDKRYFCRAWTFFHGETNRCVLWGATACCDQRNETKANPDAISGYACVKHIKGHIGCWSTEGTCPNCPPETGLFNLSTEWKKCLENNTIFWPNPPGCYQPITRGPCKEDEWIVLRDDLEDPILEAVCIKEKEERYFTDLIDEEDFSKCPDDFLTFNNFGHIGCCVSETFNSSNCRIFPEYDDCQEYFDLRSPFLQRAQSCKRNQIAIGGHCVTGFYRRRFG